MNQKMLAALALAATLWMQSARAADTVTLGLVAKLALQWPVYGYRRITAELQHHGFDVNHKRVLRMMREDNLLCIRQRAFAVTTDSRHGLPVYPNLARTITPSEINQLWVADITYIRLRTEFVYLAVILDAFSRRVVGWALGRALEAELAIAALRTALMERKPPPGLVHHSDRGVQYASRNYTEMLLEHGAIISMSRKGNPYDNSSKRKCIATNTAISTMLTPASANFWNKSITRNGCTPRSAICRRRSSSRTGERHNEVAAHHP